MWSKLLPEVACAACDPLFLQQETAKHFQETNGTSLAFGTVKALAGECDATQAMANPVNCGTHRL